MYSPTRVDLYNIVLAQGTSFIVPKQYDHVKNASDNNATALYNNPIFSNAQPENFLK
jgi:hypothetical protein